MKATPVKLSPSAAVFVGGQIYVFHRSGEQLWYTTTADGATWTSDMSISGATLSASPAAVESMGKLSVFYQGGANSGKLWKYVHESLEIVGVEYDLDKGKLRDVTTVVLYTKTVTNDTDVTQSNEVSLKAAVEETSYFENSTTSSTSMEGRSGVQVEDPLREGERDERVVHAGVDGVEDQRVRRDHDLLQGVHGHRSRGRSSPHRGEGHLQRLQEHPRRPHVHDLEIEGWQHDDVSGNLDGSDELGI